MNGKDNGKKTAKTQQAPVTAPASVNGTKQQEQEPVPAAVEAEPPLPAPVNDVAATSTGELGEEQNAEVMEIVQDIGFNVQIISPNTEPLTLQVSSMELVHEIHQLLMDREDSCHRTCFSLQLDGVTLDNFAELKNIAGLERAQC